MQTHAIYWSKMLLAAALLAGCGGSKQATPVQPPVASTPSVTIPKIVEDSKYTILESGLKIHDFIVGDGVIPTRGAKIAVHYTGWVQGGEMFDSSVARGEPFEFRLGTAPVIEGWQQGMQGMRVGGSRQLVIPPELGYGENGAGPIPANATLVFEIQLLGAGDVRIAPDPMPVVENWQDHQGGVEYSTRKEGEGPTVAPGDVMLVEVTVWQPDGTYLESTYARDHGTLIVLRPQPEASGAPNFESLFSGMKAGGIRLLNIPANLGGGAEEGTADAVQNAATVMQIELKEIRAPRTPPEAAPKLDDASLISTASGLRYTDLSLGDGPELKRGQYATIEYSGWLEDGTLFSSSYEQPDAFRIPVGMGRTIAGWEEGISTMRVGGKRLLWIPAALAYGERGAPPTIPAHANLIFEVEVLRVSDGNP